MRAAAMGDQRADCPGGDELPARTVHGTPATREDVDGPRIQLGDQRVQVLGVLVGRAAVTPSSRGCARPLWVIRDHRAVRESGGQRRKPLASIGAPIINRTASALSSPLGRHR